MLLAEDIVKGINTHLKANVLKDPVFARTRYTGLTEQVPVEDSDKVYLMPAAIDREGEAVLVAVDDEVPLHLYHKVTLKNTNRSRMQTGDTNINVQDIFNLQLIVIANRQKLGCTQAWLEGVLYRNYPDRVKDQNGRIQGYIVPGNTDFNSKRIHDQEFVGVPFDGNWYQYFMLAIDYQVATLSYKRRCEDVCLCPEQILTVN